LEVVPAEFEFKLTLIMGLEVVADEPDSEEMDELLVEVFVVTRSDGFLAIVARDVEFPELRAGEALPMAVEDTDGDELDEAMRFD
jgi:hypothetical protein